MEIDLGELRRQSKLAAVLTFVSSLVVLSAFAVSIVQANRAVRLLTDVEKQTLVLESQKTKLTTDIDSLEKRKESLQEVIQRLSTTPGVSSRAVAEAFAKTPLAATQIARVTVVQAFLPGNSSAANAVTKRLQSAGYIVLKGPSWVDENASPGTVVRYFFSHDANEAQVIAARLDNSGVGDVTIQFSKKATQPPVRSYEVWIGPASLKVLRERAVALQQAVETETKNSVENYATQVKAENDKREKAFPGSTSHSGPGSFEAALRDGMEQRRQEVAQKHLPEIEALLSEIDASPLGHRDVYLLAKVRVHEGCSPPYQGKQVSCGEALQNLVGLLPPQPEKP